MENVLCSFSHLPALGNDHVGSGSFASEAGVFDFADDVHAVGDFAEDDVFVVEERGGDGADEELAAVCVGAGVLLCVGDTVSWVLFFFKDGGKRWGGGGDWEGAFTAMLRMPGPSCLRLKFSSAKDLVP